MSKDKFPVTPGVRLLREKNVPYMPHLYTYEEHGGTRHAAASLGVPEHAVIKTLVMETDGRKGLLVLMHGDKEVSTRNLARSIGARHVDPCTPEAANKLTGYVVGGISPFGTKLPVYAERTIFDLERIYINGGKRGFLVEIRPDILKSILGATEVSVAIDG